MSDELRENIPFPAPATSAPGSRIYSPQGGSIDRSPVTFGDNSGLNVSYGEAQLPPADTVDIKAEIAALKEIIASLQIPDQKKADNALEDAEIEAEKPEPDKAEVGGAVERWLGYATKAQGFMEVAEKLKPRVEAVAAWLGANHEKILAMVGLATPS